MKKILSVLLAVCLLAVSAGFVSVSAKDGKFFYCMYDRSQFVYKADENGNISIEPMIASNGDVVAPMIVDGTTYLPFRYVFEEIFGFEDITDQAKQISDGTFYYRFSDDGIVLTFKMLDGKEKTIDLNSKYLLAPNSETFPTLKFENNITYIALRYFDVLKNPFYLTWDAETGSIYMSDQNDEYCKNCLDKLKKQKLSNNYMTYTDAVKKGSEVLPVTDMIKEGEKAYSASNNFNLALYCDESRKICYKDMNDDADKGQAITIEGDNDNLLVDRLTICGDRIYGLDVTEDGNMKGKLFTARLRLPDNENGTEYHIYADGFKYLTDTNGIIMFDIEANNAEILNTNASKALMDIYYVDANDNHSLNKISFKNVDTYQTTAPEKITVNGTPLTKIDYFAVQSDISLDSIQPQSIVYNDFDTATVKYGNFEGINIANVKNIESVPVIDFITYDSGMYYYITKTDPNKIKKITASGGDISGETEAQNGDQYNRLSVFDSSVWVRSTNGGLVQVQ